MMDRLVSLAAGTHRDVSRVAAIDAAASAGYGAIGLRLDLEPPDASGLRELRSSLASSGLMVLDVEVVRLSPDWDEEFERRLIGWAAELGARHLLVVSDEADHARTVDGLARVSERCRDAGLSAVVEFMRFAYPRTLAEAVVIARDVGDALGGVLVDALHLARSGGDPDDLDAYEASLFPYAQVCDAVIEPPKDDLEALAFEARHARLLPGEGGLPLDRLLAALPSAAPLSIEIQSDALEGTTSVQERGRSALESTNQVIERRLVGSP